MWCALHCSKKMSESQTGAGNQEFQSLNAIENFRSLEGHAEQLLSLFIGENDNAYFTSPLATPSPVSLEFKELVPTGDNHLSYKLVFYVPFILLVPS